MATLVSSVARPLSRAVLAALAVMPVLACTTPYAKVDGMLAGMQPAPAGDSVPVTVVKDGVRQGGALRLSLNAGDSLRTGPDGVAVLTLRPGYELIVEPGTEMNVENPSIFVSVGRLFLRKLREAKEALRLNTEFVSAGVEGTEFLFEVTQDDLVRLTVLEGRVSVQQRSGAGAALTLQGGQTVTIRDGQAPGPPQPVSQDQIAGLRERRDAIERATDYRGGAPWSRFKPLWQRPVILVPAAVVTAGVAVLVIRKSGTETGAVTVPIPF